MKLAIVGSREFENYDLLCAEVAKIKETQTVSPQPSRKNRKAYLANGRNAYLCRNNQTLSGNYQ